VNQKVRWPRALSRLRAPYATSDAVVDRRAVYRRLASHDIETVRQVRPSEAVTSAYALVERALAAASTRVGSTQAPRASQTLCSSLAVHFTAELNCGNAASPPSPGTFASRHRPRATATLIRRLACFRVSRTVADDIARLRRSSASAVFSWVYSMGGRCAQLLSGRHPFAASSLVLFPRPHVRGLTVAERTVRPPPPPPDAARTAARRHPWNPFLQLVSAEPSAWP